MKSLLKAFLIVGICGFAGYGIGCISESRTKKEKTKTQDSTLKMINEMNDELLDILQKMQQDMTVTHISKEELEELRVTKLKEFYGRTEEV